MRWAFNGCFYLSHTIAGATCYCLLLIPMAGITQWISCTVTVVADRFFRYFLATSTVSNHSYNFATAAAGNASYIPYAITPSTRNF